MSAPLFSHNQQITPRVGARFLDTSVQDLINRATTAGIDAKRFKGNAPIVATRHVKEIIPQRYRKLATKMCGVKPY